MPIEAAEFRSARRKRSCGSRAVSGVFGKRERVVPGAHKPTVYLRRERLPEGRVLVRLEFPDQPAHRRRLWLLIEDGEAEVCHKKPGYEENLFVVVEDPQTFARWHPGLNVFRLNHNIKP